MKAIYLISSKDRVKKNKYKFGKHTGTSVRLISRYITALIKPIIFHFAIVENNDEIEKEVLRRLDKYRIVNSRGNKSEWLQTELIRIVDTINEVTANFIKNGKKYDHIDYTESECGDGENGTDYTDSTNDINDTNDDNDIDDIDDTNDDNDIDDIDDDNNANIKSNNSFVCECGIECSSKFNLERHKNSKNCKRKKSGSKTNKKQNSNVKIMVAKVSFPEKIAC